MAHLSLYRKFRPERFEEIVRQEHVVRILRNQLEKNAIAHAYLFTGPRGTGKTTVARIFARAVNCEHPENGSPCGKCAVCRALKEGSLDVTEIDAASNNGVNEMRDLREKVQYPPVSGRYKVYVIDEVHMLTDAAFNALLKTLEEPPAHVIFILATTEPQKIPATILSRCMRLDFKLLPQEDLEAHLKSVLDTLGKPYEDAAVSAIARAGAGSDRDMLSIAEACIVYSEKLTYETVNAVLGAADFSETADLVSAMLTADMGTAISVTERILSEGKSVGTLLKDVLSLLGQVTVAKNVKDAERLLALPASFYGEVRRIADKAEGAAILRATEILMRTEADLKFVSSPRIAFEAAVMRVSRPAADSDPEALLVRIAQLERKVSELSMGAAERQEEAPHLQKKSAESVPTVQPFKAERQEVSPPTPAPAEAGPDDFPPPLEEEPIFSEAWFDGGMSAPAPSKRPPVVDRKPAPVQKTETQGESDPFGASAPAAGAQTNAEDAQTVYARFMRELRKTAKSGVLFVMCSDLGAEFEGGKLVLLTQSPSVRDALSRENHRRTMGEILSSLGISEFEIRLAGEEKPAASGLDRLKETFKDYPIEIK